ncbi:MAG: flagellar biosynthesis protein FlhF [Treponema sp. CETP13]|nr:MAG: flagellar biosynthesis protein FlhF [Treponema sp. CETP13]
MALNQQIHEPLSETADTLEDCIKEIRRKYGLDFEIIQKTQVKPTGLFSAFKPPKWQVRYVVLPQEKRNSHMRSNFSSGALTAGSNMNQISKFQAEQQRILEENKTSSSAQMKAVFDELKAMREEFQANTLIQQSEKHPNIIKIENLLEKNEFTASYIRKLTDTLRKESTLEQLDNFEYVEKTTIDYIGDTISVSDLRARSKPEIIVLVGPTGVGKTTTVAKLAANYVIPSDFNNHQSKEVRIITIDQYRIAAKQQIEKYGQVMNVPVSAANDADELHKIIKMYSSGVDVILIDTIGYSPKDYESIAKMRKVLNLNASFTKIYLTVMASTKASDLREIMRQYEIFGYSSLIITKLDETDCIGNVVSVLNEKNKSVAFYTTGQTVPRDFEKASPVGLIKRLTDFHVDREYIDSKFTVIE